MSGKISWPTSPLLIYTSRLLSLHSLPSLPPDLCTLEWPMDESLVSFSFLCFHSIPFILSLTTLNFYLLYHSSVQCSQSCPTLRPHGRQHTRLPCPSPTHWACSNSSPSTWWCHPTISYSVIPFSSHLQSFPASASFPMSQLFTSGGQSTRLPNLYFHIYLSTECLICPLKSIHG